MDAPCPRDCSQRGTCVGGSCECLPGFSGRGCETACPNRCSGHGTCIAGACECFAGHKGDDCSATVKVMQAAAMLSAGFLGSPGQFNPSELELTSPLFLVTMSGAAILVATCLLGYCINVCRGLRGLDAVPYYTYLTSTMSISDYILKPNPRPRNEEM